MSMHNLFISAEDIVDLLGVDGSEVVVVVVVVVVVIISDKSTIIIITITTTISLRWKTCYKKTI